ncbi:Protein fem-1 homolog A [Eumeta japonica]|uniref:Protein fem-1 homolog A n=1 Tax=Eumeta variegata TaxID=151549 RepID=A0A4C1W0U4_EUMVA|nr:Protein fem-1 homolog A [Eumeta japonica]
MKEQPLSVEVVIRERRTGDTAELAARAQLLRASILEHITSAFLIFLLNEVSLQLCVLISAVLFIFCGLSALKCVIVAPFTAFLIWISVSFTHYADATNKEQRQRQELFGWVAVAREPLLAYSEKRLCVILNQGPGNHQNLDTTVPVADKSIPTRHKIVGTVSVEESREPLRTGWLIALAVDPQYRRQGIGQALINSACAGAVSQGLLALEATTSEIQPEARSLLHTLGKEIDASQAERLGRSCLYCSALSPARSARAERDNESSFFVRAAGVHRFIKRNNVKKSDAPITLNLRVMGAHLRGCKEMWEEEESGINYGDGEGSGSSGPSPAKDTTAFRHRDTVFNELMQECKHSAPGARLSARLRTALERMCPTTRREVCSRTRDGCAPLFVACRRGNVEIVEYLIRVCGVDLEQRGVYEVPDDRSEHRVTPLWCAAVAGHLEVLRVLAAAGADLDASSDSGSTPVRSACFMTHLDVVRELVARGADIHRPNYNGGTCLINSVQSVRLCTFLLEHGAAVDATDMQHKSALHYAIQEHRLETARLLLEHGADPALRSRAGDDALQTACLKGAAHIVQLLVQRVPYTDERLADAFELLGSTQLDEFNDMPLALSYWRRATALRHRWSYYLEKRPLVPPRAALRYAREWRTLAELEAAATDMDAMRVQSLLVCERVLGLHHKDTVFRLMYRGASYADAFRYQQCIDLWTWALQIRIEKDSLLYTDTVHTACALTRLMLDARGERLERARGLPRYNDVAGVFALLVDYAGPARRALDVRPVYKKQAETFDRALRCLTHLAYLLLETADTSERQAHARGLLRRAVAARLRSAHTGDTLLHLCVSRLNVIRSTYFGEEPPPPAPVFPQCGVVRALLEAGADPRMRNESRSTPLHVAAIPYNFSSELVELLLSHGAHIDQPNRFGDLPAALIIANRTSRVRPLRHLSLACLAASALVRHAVPVPEYALPLSLRNFLELHRP